MRRYIICIALVAGCHHHPQSGAVPFGDGGAPGDAAIGDGSTSTGGDGFASNDGGGDGSSQAGGDGGAILSTGADGGAVIGSGGTGLCIEDGWCWERPSPFGVSLNGVWGSKFEDVWAVGDGGTILHFDGSAWTRLTPITPESLYDVHGSGPDDVWAVGRRVILHFDGKSWSTVANVPATKGLLRTVFARAADDVWFGGDWFAILHWDGKSWSLSEQPTIQSARTIIAFATDDVWAAGDDAFVSHFDGKSWTWTSADFSEDYPACVSSWGTAHDNFYLGCGAGYGDTVQHWDGNAWHRVVFPTGVDPGPTVVVGSTTSDLWLFSPDWNCASWDGTTWTRHMELEDDAINDAWLDASGHGFAVGGGGRILRRDGGATWTAVSGTKGGSYDDLGGVFAVADDDTWVVGRLTLLRFDGKNWNTVPPANTPYREEFGSVWASGPDDAWIVGWGDFPNSIQRWNGTAFTVPTPRPDYQGYVDEVWGTAKDDVWIVNDGGEVLHWDGGALSYRYSNPGGVGSRGAVHGTASDDVWTLGGGLRHWDGHTLTLDTTVPALPMYASLVAVHAVARDDVWLTGEQGVVYRWNGSAWTTPPVPPLRPDVNGNLVLAGFAGSSSSDLWAVGTDGDIFHFDGASWRKSATAGVGLSRIGRTPGGQLLAVGANGAILRRR